MSLLVIGTLAYDTVETPFDRRERALGGSAVYFAMAASAFGPVRMAGIVGEDFAASDLELLRARGVDTQGIEHAKGESFHWGGSYAPDWNTRTTLFTRLNVLEQFHPKLPKSYCESHYVFLANAEPAVQLEALAQCSQRKFVVADTMNFWIDKYLPDLKRVLREVDGIVLNDEEARMLAGETNLIRAARKVLSMGPRYVVLKKGEHGAFLIGRDAHFSLPAYPVDQVIDPTGAGDCFAGGFMAAIAEADNTEPRTLRRAMLYGTVTASYCVQGFSIEDIGRRKRPEIEARFQELLQITTV
ncbi:MAG TPA: PfkB family carbohydrate kinase [Planctomycetota bacterium]|nr:PfkB family carbohydrate kinase [Planctomycetota bacterium]